MIVVFCEIEASWRWYILQSKIFWFFSKYFFFFDTTSEIISLPIEQTLCDELSKINNFQFIYNLYILSIIKGLIMLISKWSIEIFFF